MPENLMKEIKEQIENSIASINEMLDGASIGISIREGFLIAILGKPNTGKSSFINNISNQEIAIVTNKPGTTRDVLESYIDLNGLPVRFYDTAGIRKYTNSIERIGIRKSKKISLKKSNLF